MPPKPVSTVTGAMPSADSATTPQRPSGRGGVRLPAAVPIWAWPGALALLFAVWHIGRPQLWRDENATWSGVGRTFPELLHLLGNVDASTGLYYVLLHGWTDVFGLSTVAMRLPSAFFVAVAAGAVACVGRRLFGDAAGLAAGVLFAVTPAVSRYGQEARAYALVVMAAAVALLFLLRALERPGVTRWLLYGVAAAFMGAAHLVALAALVGHGVIVLLHARRDRSWRTAVTFAGVVAGVAALLAPLLLLSHSQVGRQLYWVHRPDLVHPQVAFGHLWEALVGSTASAVVLGLFVVAGLALARGNGPARGTAAAGAILPIVAVTLVSETGTSYFLARYLLFTLPCWAVLAGAGLVAAGRAVARLLPVPRQRAVLALVTACGLALTVAVTLPDQQRLRSFRAHEWISYPVKPLDTYFSYQGAARTITAHARPGDGLVYVAYWGDMIDLGVDYYLGPQARTLDQFFMARTPQQNGTYRPTYCAVPASCVAHAPNRVWVVRQTAGYTHPAAPLAAQLKALQQDYRVAQTFRLSRVDVMLLVRTTPS
ncbi:glycosyltransferase family 39 protein [Streptacidiphilus melanogenes]|uniref:glycosyltransferase family 39 protein n=1 Tax=Streptacidiphilus melanogenes TaxID=411235 RepID=UPI0005A71802|nr:glycosyltransferase family 39 protein [Streptacidiphilus melanogenes]